MARKRTTIAQWITEAAVPVLALDPRRRVRVFNRGAQQLTGREPGEVLGHRADPNTDPDHAPPGSVAELLGVLCPTPDQYGAPPSSVRVPVPTPDGPREVLRLAVPLSNPDDETRLLLVLLPAELGPPAPPPPGRHAALAAARTAVREKYRLDRLVTADPAMDRVLRQADLARGCTASVHIHGEPGTGRRHLALTIHLTSSGHGRPVEVLTFAGAGRLEQERDVEWVLDPDRPTAVVLSDIDRLSADLQAELADGLPQEDRQHDDPDRALRFLTTSTKPLAELDIVPRLARRLGTIEVGLPALRDRPADLPLLAQHVVEDASRGRQNPPAGLSDTVLAAFADHPWPGNVAELVRTVDEATRACTGSLIEPDDLPFSFRTGREAALTDTEYAEPLRPLAEVLEDAERAHLTAALARAKGNKAAAARLLGTTRPKLYRRLEQLNIS